MAEFRPKAKVSFDKDWPFPYHRALMLDGTPVKVLPRSVEPRKLVQQHAAFRGIVPGDCLTRLADATVSASPFSTELCFVLGESGEKLMHGTISGEVEVYCQRCLEPVACPLQVDFKLAIVWDEAQAKGLPRHLDPWIVAEQEADLYFILEEELLLALPIVSYHRDVCIDASAMSTGEAASETPQRADNPFDVLKKLKKEQSAD